MKRAERRHHRSRLITKVTKRLQRWYWYEVDITLLARKQVNNRKVCSSCLCCGNPRKMWKEPTLAEKRASFSEKEYLDGYKNKDGMVNYC